MYIETDVNMLPFFGIVIWCYPLWSVARGDVGPPPPDIMKLGPPPKPPWLHHKTADCKNGASVFATKSDTTTSLQFSWSSPEETTMQPQSTDIPNDHTSSWQDSSIGKISTMDFTTQQMMEDPTTADTNSTKLYAQKSSSTEGTPYLTQHVLLILTGTLFAIITTLLLLFMVWYKKSGRPRIAPYPTSPSNYTLPHKKVSISTSKISKISQNMTTFQCTSIEDSNETFELSSPMIVVPETNWSKATTGVDGRDQTQGTTDEIGNRTGSPSLGYGSDGEKTNSQTHLYPTRKNSVGIYPIMEPIQAAGEPIFADGTILSSPTPRSPLPDVIKGGKLVLEPISMSSEGKLSSGKRKRKKKTIPDSMASQEKNWFKLPQIPAISHSMEQERFECNESTT